MPSGYRDSQAAVRDRLGEHRLRLERLDEEVEAAPSSRRLARGLRSELEALRDRAEPANDTVQALVVAERAAEDYERKLDEALGLDAELRKAFKPVLPRREVWLRWAGFLAMSVGILLVTVHQMDLDEFMLHAFGVKVQRAAGELSSIPVQRALAAVAPEPATHKPLRIERIRAVRRPFKPAKRGRR